MASNVRRGPWSKRALDRPRADDLRAELAALLGRFGVSEEQSQLLLLMLDQRTAPTSGAKRRGRYAIVDPLLNAAVVSWAFEHAARPRVTIKLWLAMQAHLLTSTNEVMMDRRQMIEAAGAKSAHVSEALAELASIDAVKRIRRGREVRWRLTTLAATHLTGSAREKAQDAEPALLAAIREAEPPA